MFPVWRLTPSAFVIAAVLAIPAWTGAQEQSSTARPWPCGGRLDPTYFQIAEGTGGHLILVAPAEIADAAPLTVALGNHRQTVLRSAGTTNPGVHEFRFPIDSSVESVVFSISVQCLRTAVVTRPSGATLTAGDGVTELANFQAQRAFVVTRPETGIWSVRVAGSGVGGVMVQARSSLSIDSVEFAAAGSREFSYAPAPGVENVVRIGLSGGGSDVQGSLVDAAFRQIAALPLTPAGAPGSYVSRFTPGTEGFRVRVEGKDADGVSFQRVHAPLVTPGR
jgi:hypothetical protein